MQRNEYFLRTQVYQWVTKPQAVITVATVIAGALYLLNIPVTKPQAVITVATNHQLFDGALKGMVTKPQAVITVATKLERNAYEQGIHVTKPQAVITVATTVIGHREGKESWLQNRKR